MSLEAMTWVWRQRVKPAGAKLVLLALADHADERGFCYPSHQRIAAYTSQGLSTVREHLLSLERDSWIKHEQRRTKGRQTSNGYWLLWLGEQAPKAGGRNEAASETRSHQAPKAGGRQPPSFGGEPSYEPSEEPSARGHAREGKPPQRAAGVSEKAAGAAPISAAAGAVADIGEAACKPADRDADARAREREAQLSEPGALIWQRWHERVMGAMRIGATSYRAWYWLLADAVALLGEAAVEQVHAAEAAKGEPDFATALRQAMHRHQQGDRERDRARAS